MLNLKKNRYQNTRKIFVIGEELIARQIKDKIRYLPYLNYNYLGFYNGNGNYQIRNNNGNHKNFRLSTLKDFNGLKSNIIKFIEHTEPHDVLITKYLSYDTVTDIILHLGKSSLNILVAPEIYEKQIGRLNFRAKNLLLPAINLKKDNLSKPHKWLKRIVDITLSLVALLLTSPLFLIIPLLIKLSSKGPVFYTQIRAGQNGYPFKLYKFRSMINDADKALKKRMDFNKLKEPVYKIKKDSRITPIGRFLRKTSIDELPQIFNVIKGDMSWIGPRPEDIKLVKKYNAFYKERLRAKPGITGLQQIKYRGGPSLYQRLQHDLFYIEKQSIWLDIKIFLKSIWVVLSQKGAW